MQPDEILMKTRVMFAGGLAIIGFLTGCETIPPGAERGPNGTMAYLVQIESSPPEARIEANGEVVGTAPLTLKIFGDPDGTFHDFGSYFYIIRTLPSQTNHYVQTATLRTGHLLTQKERLPKRISLQMTQPAPAAPPYYEPGAYGPPVYYGPAVYFG